MTVAETYRGSDAEATKRLYAQLEQLGTNGVIAMNLLRANKASARAKVYRGGIRGQGSFKNMAYEKKNWSLRQLCAALAESKLTWGWKRDPVREAHAWVLYVELPTGQVSFHASGPVQTEKVTIAGDGLRHYAGEWDGTHLSAERIIVFAEDVIGGTPSKRLGAYAALAQAEIL